MSTKREREYKKMCLVPNSGRERTELCVRHSPRKISCPESRTTQQYTCTAHQTAQLSRSQECSTAALLSGGCRIRRLRHWIMSTSVTGLSWLAVWNRSLTAEAAAKRDDNDDYGEGSSADRERDESGVLCALSFAAVRTETAQEQDILARRVGLAQGLVDFARCGQHRLTMYNRRAKRLMQCISLPLCLDQVFLRRRQDRVDADCPFC